VLINEASLHCSTVLTDIDFSMLANLSFLFSISSSANSRESNTLFSCVMSTSFSLISVLFKNILGIQYTRKPAINTAPPPITIGFICINSVIINSQNDFLSSIGMDLAALRITIGSTFINFLSIIFKSSFIGLTELM
jgi:hypothetical protein